MFKDDAQAVRAEDMRSDKIESHRTADGGGLTSTNTLYIVSYHLNSELQKKYHDDLPVTSMLTSGRFTDGSVSFRFSFISFNFLRFICNLPVSNLLRID